MLFIKVLLDNKNYFYENVSIPSHTIPDSVD